MPRRDRAVAGELVALASRAEGNPFLVEELLAAAASAGALVHDGAEWTIVGIGRARWCRSRSPTAFAADSSHSARDTRRVLAAAAVIGRRFDWSLLPSITGATDDAVLEALRSGIAGADPRHRAGAPAPFLFRHALTRDVVLAELLPPERAELARRALAAVDGRHPGLPGQWCELAAELAHAAGDRERSAGLLLEVGRRAFDAGALASAEVALDRARSHAGAQALLEIDELLVEVLSLSGKRDRAFEVSASLLPRLGRRSEDATRRADVHLLLDTRRHRRDRLARRARAARRRTN